MNQRKILGRLVALIVLFGTSSAAAQMPMDHSTSTDEIHRIDQPISVKVGVVLTGVTLIGLELWWFLFSQP